MTVTADRPFDDLCLDHVACYVDSVATTRAWLQRYGFEVFAVSRGDRDARSLGIGRDEIRLVITEPLINDHPGAAYVAAHGDGVGDIALRVPDAVAAFAEAVRRGAQPVRRPVHRAGITTATIAGFADVTHTFVGRAPDIDRNALPGLTPVVGNRSARPAPRLSAMDHFAVCLEPRQLAPTVEFYQRVLDFDMIFAERIQVGAQAMDSQVVQSRSGAVTLTLIAPDTTQEPGQIDAFLKSHSGGGVQHIAFATDNIVEAVSLIEAGGVRFLEAPDAYYELLETRLKPASHSVAELRERRVLADQDHHGQLFQIFARSVHPRQTFFIEVIERLGARTFGSSNINALYRAVELQRRKDEASPAR